MANTGKTSERFFEAQFAGRKDAWLERRIDLAHLRGLNPNLKGLRFPPQPSDYLLTMQGKTYYCEVKSCSNKTSFPFSQIEKGQWNAAIRVTAAGGTYLFFLHNVVTDNWYVVAAAVIIAKDKEGKASIPWSDLTESTNLWRTL